MMRSNGAVSILLALGCLLLAVLIAAAGARASDTVIFADDFESALAGWTTSGKASWYAGTPKIGTHSVKVPKNASIQRTASTVGWRDIKVSFWIGANLGRKGLAFQALWFNGTAWTLLEEIRYKDADADGNLHYFEFALPPAAANNSRFALRFKISTKSPDDAGYVDNVTLTAGSPFLCTLALDGAGGSVKVNGVPQTLPWSGEFSYGESVIVEAVPDAGYHFTGWSGDLTGSENPAVIQVDSDQSITASFALDTYLLTISSGTGHGSITVDSILHSLPWQGTFDRGATVLLEAVPDPGYHFTGWSGALSGITNPALITMDGDQAVSAGFASDTYVLHLSGSGAGAVKVNGIPHNLPDTIAVAYDTTVTLEATPATGWHFTAWSGDLSGAENPTSLLVDSDKAVTADFALDQYPLDLFGAGNGTVSVDGANHPLPWSGAFSYGDIVVLEAVPASGSHFTAWSGDLSGSANPTLLLIDGPKTVIAGFALNTYTLTIAGTNGTVRVNGLARPLPWSGMFAAGEVVNLEALPVEGYLFVSWSGDLTGSENPTTITMNANSLVFATFEVSSCTLTVSGTNGSLNVDDVSQTLPYSAAYDYGAVVSLEAVADPGYRFTAWSGDLTGTTNPADLTMDGDKSVTAGFSTGRYLLSLSGTGGTVVVDGIPQALPWSGEYDYGVEVALEAVPDPCLRFSQWSGSLDSADNPLLLAMDGDKTLTPEFESIVVFNDVACEFWAAQEIAACYFAAIVSGYEGGLYESGWPVTRDQMAVYLARALAGGDLNVPDGPPQATFDDVPTSHWAYKYVEFCLAQGVVQGYDPTTYAPTVTVTRDQMAVYLARALAGGDSNVPDGPPQATFDDVPTSHWAYKYVEFCLAQGVVQGYSPTTYAPTVTVTRDQMAVYIARAFQLPL